MLFGLCKPVLSFLRWNSFLFRLMFIQKLNKKRNWERSKVRKIRTEKSRETDGGNAEGIPSFASSAEFNKLWPAAGFVWCASRGSVPCSKWTVAASTPQMLRFTHLLLRPPPESGSLGTDKLCLGKSGRMGAGRLHAADPDPTPPSCPGKRLKSICLSGRGNFTVPWTPVWRRSQNGTEQGLAWDDSSEGNRLNSDVSGISQAWREYMIQPWLNNYGKEGEGEKNQTKGQDKVDKKSQTSNRWRTNKNKDRGEDTNKWKEMTKANENKGG